MVQRQKRARRDRALRGRSSNSLETLVQEGQAAFDRQDHTAAIHSWEVARSNADPGHPLLASLTKSLAEAYLQRGMTVSPPDLTDLQQAVDLDVKTPRFVFQLAHAYQKHGELQQAIDLYRSLLSKSPPYMSAAFPLAAALVGRDSNPADDPVWDFLSPDERDRIASVYALKQHRPAPRRQSDRLGGADDLWPGLAAIASRDFEAGAATLKRVLDEPDLPVLAGAVAHYYLGIAAWEQDERSRALSYWQAAFESGLDTPWLRKNLVAAGGMLAIQHIQAADQQTGSRLGGTFGEQIIEHLAEAQRLVQLGLDAAPGNPQLEDIQRHLYLRLGYEAALAGHWSQALEHWQAADRSGETGRDLLFNVALARQKLGQYAQSADVWRQVLRRRPRKANVPDAWNKEQVARLWRHAAENYRQAGDVEEAVKCYRNAVKWAPDDVELRMGLVAALMADDRLSAAESLVGESLAAHPNHVEALAWRAQMLEARWCFREARRTWQRVLELEPDHAQASIYIAHLYEREGNQRRQQARYKRAINAYKKGLEILPDSARLSASIGTCYALQGDVDNAHKWVDRILSLQEGTQEAYYWAVRVWLEVGSTSELQAVLERVEALPLAPQTDFYLDLVEYCRHIGEAKWANYFLNRAVEHDSSDPGVLVEVGLAMGESGRFHEAVDYFQRAIKGDPELAVAHMWLGTYYVSDLHEVQLGEYHWDTARQIARRNGDMETLIQLRMIRSYFRSQQGLMTIDDEDDNDHLLEDVNDE